MEIQNTIENKNIKEITETNIDLSSVPLDRLIAEIEARKDDEIRKLVSEINLRLNKLKSLGFAPFNKDTLENVDETWNLECLGINTRGNNVISVYFNEYLVLKQRR